MRKMLSAALLVCIVALLTLWMPAVHATRPIPVSGTVDYTFEIIETRVSDEGNIFIYATEDEVWVEDFVGTGEAVFRVGMFFEEGLPIFWNVWLRSTFTGTVHYGELDKEGTMVIELVGKKPEGMDWYGQWVIISGTDDLADLRGQGTWGGPGFGAEGPDLWYSGQIYFKPD